MPRQHHHRRPLAALAAAAVLSLAAIGAAGVQAADNQATSHGHSHGHMSAAAAAPAAAESPSTAAYKAVMDKMHHDMMIEYSGDADRDFVAGMIPHHQGAIDMAEVVLKYGKDPEVRELAEKVVADQQKEITEMKALLEKAE